MLKLLFYFNISCIGHVCHLSERNGKEGGKLLLFCIFFIEFCFFFF